MGALGENDINYYEREVMNINERVGNRGINRVDMKNYIEDSWRCVIKPSNFLHNPSPYSEQYQILIDT